MRDEKKMEIIAEICHEINRAYCFATGDASQIPWPECSEEQKDIVIDGVRYHMTHPEVSPSESHNNWLEKMEADGWVRGDEKNEEKKEHPGMVPFKDLPVAHKVKDYIFTQVILSLTTGERLAQLLPEEEEEEETKEPEEKTYDGGNLSEGTKEPSDGTKEPSDGTKEPSDETKDPEDGSGDSVPGAEGSGGLE